MRLTGHLQYVKRCQRRSALTLVAVVATLGVAACGGASVAPTSPGGGLSSAPADILALEVSCPAALLIGEKGPCIAVARLRSGQAPVVSFDATWSSTGPEVVTVDALGIVNDRKGVHQFMRASVAR
jgi:hypothetical protein